MNDQEFMESLSGGLAADGLSAEEVKIMKHALGLNPWQNPKQDGESFVAYRNRYAAARESREDGMWQGLCEKGLAEGSADRQYVWYRVTDKGVRCLEAIMGRSIIQR